jgi:hypothetical protein
MLFGWRSEWSTPEYQGTAIIFVTVAQMLCGVAKDLTKLGGKTVTKLVTPDEQQVGGPTAAHLEVQVWIGIRVGMDAWPIM